MIYIFDIFDILSLEISIKIIYLLYFNILISLIIQDYKVYTSKLILAFTLNNRHPMALLQNFYLSLI